MEGWTVRGLGPSDPTEHVSDRSAQAPRLRLQFKLEMRVESHYTLRRTIDLGSRQCGGDD